MSEHHHNHDHDHEHEHSHDFTPEQELLALVHYMAHHNADHADELEDLAEKINEIGNNEAYNKLTAAIAKFREGTELLEEVMELMQ